METSFHLILNADKIKLDYYNKICLVFISREFLNIPEFDRIIKKIPVEKTILKIEFRIIT